MNDTFSNKEKNSLGNYAAINGIHMYYELHGMDNQEPLVLVHGGGSTIPSNWGTLLPMFTPYYKVIAMELQAHGRTGDRNTPESFSQDAADVIALLQHLKITKAHMIGFSDGACTTMEIVIHHPEIVNRVVLISGNYKRSGMVPGFFDGLEKATFNDMPPALKEAYLQVNPDADGLLNMFQKDREKRLHFKDRSDEELRAVKTPALIILGDQDVITTEHAVQMVALIPGARLAILPGNHGSFIGEALTFEAGSKVPEITVGVIMEFLAKDPK